METAYHFPLLLIGFDTLTYQKDYDRSPILVGHQRPINDHEEKKKGNLITNSNGIDTNLYADSGTTEHITGELDKLAMRQFFSFKNLIMSTAYYHSILDLVCVMTIVKGKFEHSVPSANVLIKDPPKTIANSS